MTQNAASGVTMERRRSILFRERKAQAKSRMNSQISAVAKHTVRGHRGKVQKEVAGIEGT